MDDQHIEEIAKACAVRFYSHNDSCDSHEDMPCDCGLENYRERMAAFVARTVREALAEQEEELRSLREERDALKAQIQGVGIVPYLDRMKELAEARDTEHDRADLAEIDRDGTAGERDYYKGLVSGILADYPDELDK